MIVPFTTVCPPPEQLCTWHWRFTHEVPEVVSPDVPVLPPVELVEVVPLPEPLPAPLPAVVPAVVVPLLPPAEPPAALLLLPVEPALLPEQAASAATPSAMRVMRERTFMARSRVLGKSSSRLTRGIRAPNLARRPSAGNDNAAFQPGRFRQPGRYELGRCACRFSAPARSGRSMMNEAPWPSSDCTRMVPPCWATTRCTTTSPSPVPVDFVVANG